MSESWLWRRERDDRSVANEEDEPRANDGKDEQASSVGDEEAGEETAQHHPECHDDLPDSNSDPVGQGTYPRSGIPEQKSYVYSMPDLKSPELSPCLVPCDLDGLDTRRRRELSRIESPGVRTAAAGPLEGSSTRRNVRRPVRAILSVADNGKGQVAAVRPLLF